MKIFKKESSIDFMGKRRLAIIMSVTLLVLSLASIFTRGLNFGIDFTGGTLVEIGYKSAVEPSAVRSVLQQAGFDDAIVQSYGTARDVLVRLAPRKDLSSAQISNRMLDALYKAYPDQVELRRVEFVGPQVGDELTEDGGLAMIYALAGILIYVALRFEKRFAVGAVMALIHDVIITIGFFSILQIEFDLTVLAAVLAVIGYSLNDTIVVYDRIRENFRRMRKADNISIMNVAINQTLSRTIITSLTTLLVLIALFLLGGEIIHGFSIALIVGIVVGTYSSIYVASAAVLMLGISRADLMPVVKEGGGVDDRP
jgi:preprotein translocase subunit SecF